MRPLTDETKTTRPRDARSRGEHGLRDGELADHVDLELAAQLVQWQSFKRPADHDAGVVDDGVEAWGKHPVERRDWAASVMSSGDGSRARRRRAVPADAGVHVPARAGEPRRDRRADAAGRARDENGRHYGRSLTGSVLSWLMKGDSAYCGCPAISISG